MKAHGSQLRASGDPYFHHPVEVAGILTGFKLDSASIATALLHDTVEDTGATLEEIERLFGRTVARLVDGVTKLNRLELQSAQTAQAENFRKLLLAMSEDIRVLLVKLADRLHNMRTLHFIKNPDKRRRIAAETMEIYAPLAERIGMETLKAELEDLAFAELRPDARESVLHRLRHLRQGDVDLVDRIVAELTQVLQHGRHRGRDLRPREDALLDLAQDGAQERQLRAAVRHHGVPRPCRQPADLLRGAGRDPRRLPHAARAVQRLHQHAQAQRLPLAAHHDHRPGAAQDRGADPHPRHARGVRARRRRALGLQAGRAGSPRASSTAGSASFWTSSSMPPGPEEFLENTKLEMFQDQVFCFTPKGDLIALPRGATPVDFAYAVHSQVGDRCVGAKIDGRMVQLRAQLQNGDQVEIITSKSGTPSPEWERFVVTGKARARIRRYLRLRQREEHVAQAASC